VEHPVTEEVTGIDLVREQFRIANGEELGYQDPAPVGHSFEFRINGEDAGRGFLPAPGVVAVFEPPSGPGVRLDSGVVAGDVIGGAFDSMLAKLIVSGRDRHQALERSRRALAEFRVEGLPTVLPFHRAVVSDPAFAPEGDKPFSVHTRWIETEFDNQIPPYAGPVAEVPEETGERQTVVVEVGGKRLEVVLPGGLSLGGGASATKKKAPRRSGSSKAGTAVSGDSLTAPMQGTIVKIAVEEGQEVAEGDLVVVLEAMKMEQPINAHKAGTISALAAQVGQTVGNGAVIAEIKD
jgi:acetyl-CoA/propionyl-CoA carboxylase biotin carboxyl carrier protein